MHVMPVPLGPASSESLEAVSSRFSWEYILYAMVWHDRDFSLTCSSLVLSLQVCSKFPCPLLLFGFPDFLSLVVLLELCCSLRALSSVVENGLYVFSQLSLPS